MLTAATASADPPIFAIGWFGPEHSDLGRVDLSADHQSISWVTLGHAQRGEARERDVFIYVKICRQGCCIWSRRQGKLLLKPSEHHLVIHVPCIARLAAGADSPSLHFTSQDRGLVPGSMAGS